MGTSDKAVFLQSYFLDVLSWDSNIMTDKGLNIFDDFTARCVKFPLMYTFFLRGQ